MQFHWPSLALGIVGVLLIISGVNGSYRTVWPAIAASFRLPEQSEKGGGVHPGKGGGGGGGGGGGKR